VTRRDGNRRATSLLRRSRLLRHWTLEQAADALFQLCTEQERRQRRGDINAKMISAWERGKHVPDAFWREKLCRLYEASAQDLGFVEPVSQQVPSSVRMSASLPGERVHNLPVIVTPSEHVQAMHVLEQRACAPLRTQASAWLLLGVDHLAHLFEEGWSVDDILASLQTVLQGVQVMSKVNRRHLLKLGAAVVLSGVALPASSHVTAEEQMQLCNAFQQNIAIGWKLFTKARNAQALAVSQAQLALLQHMHSALPISDRSSLYSSIYNLMGMAFCHQGDAHHALQAHTNAYIAALGAGDTVGVIQSLLSQANDYHVLGHYSTAIETVEQALRLCGEVHDQPLVRTKAHLLGVWADNAMMAAAYATARLKLEAVAALLDHLSPNEQFDRSSWYQLRGKYAYVTGDYAAAAQWYEQALRELPAGWTIRQILVLMPLLSTYTALQDRDASLMVMEKAAQVVPGLNAPIIAQPLSDALQGLVIVFPREARVKTGVADLLQHIRYTLPGMSSPEPGLALP
jgi:tetratricopeptide (TPR) repeat protein/transcriptional regulator with XRE-family HTH domain